MAKKAARSRGFFDPRKKNAKQLRHARVVAGDDLPEIPPNLTPLVDIAPSAEQAANAFASMGNLLSMEMSMSSKTWEQLGEQIVDGFRTGLRGYDKATEYPYHNFTREDELAQQQFTTWEGHLALDAHRLKNIVYEQATSLVSPAGFVEFENIPEPRTRYALEHKPGSVYRAGPNEWYCESGTVSDKTGSGYLVTRAHVPELDQMRWFCTCVRFKQYMYSDEPYCKHIYAVRQFTRDDKVYDWLDMPSRHDIAAWLAWCEDFGLMDESDFMAEELFDIIPDLEEIMKIIRHTGI